MPARPARPARPDPRPAALHRVMQTALCGVVGTTPDSQFVTIDTRCYGRAVASGAKARMRTEVAADLSSQEPPVLLRAGDRASGVAFLGRSVSGSGLDSSQTSLDS